MQNICLFTDYRSNSSIWPIDRTLSGATTPGQCGLVNNGNKGALHIPQISKAGSMSYPGHFVGWRITP